MIRDSSNHPTGYWAEEALKAYERFVAAGADVVVMTPDGRAPVADPYSLEPIFHYPDQDRDYFASIYRTFHRDPDDIRITLRHSTEQQLVAARRIVFRLVDAGRTPTASSVTLSGSPMCSCTYAMTPLTGLLALSLAARAVGARTGAHRRKLL